LALETGTIANPKGWDGSRVSCMHEISEHLPATEIEIMRVA
jgi:hypothetical protein